MRVLFAVPGSLDSATARYRCAHLAEALAGQGHQADIVSATETAAINVRHDVVVLHRLRWTGIGQRLIAAARSIGAATVYSADDLIFEPEFAYQVGIAHPDDPARYHYHRGEVADALRCFLASDAALVSTEFLAARARFAFTNGENGSEKPVFVVRNFLAREILACSHAVVKRRPVGFPAPGDGGDQIVLGYLSGSPTHDADLAGMAPALSSALAASPGTRLLIVGPATLPHALLAAAEAGQIQRHPFVPWRDLPGLLAGIDINLAPLDTTRVFNHAKSEVKFLEAAAVGVPTIASAGLGFAEGVRDGDDCLLTHRSSDWEETITRLTAEAPERERLGMQAQRSLFEHATVSAVADAVGETFACLADLGRSGSPSSVTVRQPAAEQFERAFRRVEEGFLRRCFRITRHLRLLKGKS